MTSDTVIAILQRATWVSFEAAGPLLAIGLVVGLIMGLVQAATQISEPSLTFVPKLAVLGLSLGLVGPWVLERLTSLTTELFTAIGGL